jgi:hypothetical protein
MPNCVRLDFSGINCDLNQMGSLSLCEGRYLNANESVKILPHMTDVSTAIGSARNPDGQFFEQVANKACHPWRRFSDLIEHDWIRVRSQILEQLVLANDDVQFLVRPADSVSQAIAKPAKARRFVANGERQSLAESPQKCGFADSGRANQ